MRGVCRLDSVIFDFQISLFPQSWQSGEEGAPPIYLAMRPMNETRNTNPDTGIAISRNATRARGRSLVHQAPAARKANWARACKKTMALLRADCSEPASGSGRAETTAG